MNYQPEALRVYRFHPDRLDPITVYVEQYGPTASRITVQCYAQAWTAYWGSHGANPVEDFVVRCHPEYVAENLTWGNNGRMLKRVEKLQRDYLVRIAEAIQAEFAKTKGGKA